MTAIKQVEKRAVKKLIPLLCSNIIYVRQLNNVNQKDFAASIGITRSALSSYEEGRAMPKIETLCNLCERWFFTADEMLFKDLYTYKRPTGLPSTNQPTPNGKIV